MQENKSEIDLRDVFYQFALTVKLNLKLILILIVTGMLLGLVYSYYSKKIYEGRLIVQSGLLTLSFTDGIFANINSLIRENNIEQLSRDLHISAENAESLVKFEVSNLIEDKTNTLKEGEKNSLLIKVQTTDPDIFPQVQTGLITYIENNPFVKIRVQQRNEFLKEMIAKTEAEISDLEKLKMKIFQGDFMKSSDGNMMFDPTSVTVRILELTKEKINSQHSLALSNNTHVIDPITATTQPAWPRKSVVLMIGSIFGLVAAFLIIFITTVSENLKSRQTQIQ